MRWSSLGLACVVVSLYVYDARLGNLLDPRPLSPQRPVCCMVNKTGWYRLAAACKLPAARPCFESRR
jgi:hypothetical protein